MSHAAIAARPWNLETRIIPADCHYPNASESHLDSHPQTVSGRLIPVGSICPEIEEHGTKHATAQFLGAGVIPEDTVAPIQTGEATRERAKKLQFTMGLTGTVVPVDSTLTAVATTGAAAHSLWDENFSSAFLSSNRLPGHSRRSTLTYAMVFHAVLLTIVLLLPVMFPEQIRSSKFLVTMMAPPPQFTTGAPQPVAVQPKPNAPVRPPTKRVFTQNGKLVFPAAIPKHAAVIDEAPLEPAPSIGAGVYGGLPAGPGDLLGALGQPAAPPPAMLPSPAEPVAEGPRQLLRVGGDVKPPRLIHQADPIYPKLARASRIQGDVVISTIINARGDVEEMKIVSGPPLLYSAALAAVKEWKFEPTYLNGQPWPIAHEVTIHFRL